MRAAACAALRDAFRLSSGCDDKKDETASSTTAPAAGAIGDKPLTVGFLYVGTKDDNGYNQAHADGAAAVDKIPA